MSFIIQTITKTSFNLSNLVFVRFLRSQLKLKPKLSVQAPIPVFRKAATFYNKVALRDSVGNYTYENLSIAAQELSEEISKKVNEKINSQILFLCPNDASYVITQWAIWMSGQAAVPVSNLHSPEMIKYCAKNSESKLLITTSENAELFDRIATDTKIDLMVLDRNLKETALTKTVNKLNLDNMKSCDVDNTNAMILYTNGSTGVPKGVVLTHKQILNRINALVDAWKLTSEDTVLHALPLCQSHGIIDGLLCPFYVGAKCIMLPKFNANDVWAHFLGIKSLIERQKITVFMGTPNIYTLLIEEYNTLFSRDLKIEDYIRSTLKLKTRLMTCADTVSSILYQKWFEVTGHNLLLHYGMIETGLFFSQIYGTDYQHGYVGLPLKGCSVRIIKKNEEDKYETVLECSNYNNGVKVQKQSKNVIGELLLRGDGVFQKYFDKPIGNEFTDDDWYKPGDTCEYSSEKNMFKVLGKTDGDIIAAEGFKISALQLETQLLTHPKISDCAVLEVSDDKLGHCIAALVVLKSEVSCDSLMEWMKSNMPEDSAPKIIKVVDHIPKNAIGKVNKAELSLKMFVNNEEVFKR